MRSYAKLCELMTCRVLVVLVSYMPRLLSFVRSTHIVHPDRGTVLGRLGGVSTMIAAYATYLLDQFEVVRHQVCDGVVRHRMQPLSPLRCARSTQMAVVQWSRSQSSFVSALQLKKRMPRAWQSSLQCVRTTRVGGEAQRRTHCRVCGMQRSARPSSAL